MAVTFQLVSYNVLSSHLANAEYFTHCDPSDLDPATRLQRVIEKLGEHVATGAVICLQEVSRDWGGKLQTFFQQSGYTFITSSYAGASSGYMGVGLAFPNCKWRLLDADIRRVSDSKYWPSEEYQPKLRVGRLGDWTCPACNAHVFASRTDCYKCQARKPKGGLRDWFCSCFGGALAPPLQTTRLPTEMLYLASARKRENTVVAVHLQNVGCEKQAVWIGCYHMPCAFREPRLMVMHAALVMQHIQRLAIATTSPCVLAGDWNFKPGDDAYKLVTSGDLPEDSSAFPIVARDDNWKPKLLFPMRSAYFLRHGREPDFTNFTQTDKDEEPFIDTLDYIFCSPQMTVRDVLALPNRTAVAGPLPISFEPSDHILISATLELTEFIAAATAALHHGRVPTKVRTRQEANEKIRQELAAQLDSFMSSEKSAMCFPPDLTAFQRKLVHDLAGQLGLQHNSYGERAARCIQVEK